MRKVVEFFKGYVGLKGIVIDIFEVLFLISDVDLEFVFVYFSVFNELEYKFFK